MAIVSANELHTGRGARYSASAKAYEFTRVFRVTCDDIEDGPAAAIVATGVPIPGDTYFGYKLKDKDVKDVDDSGYVFDVLVSYTSDEKSAAPNENPVDRDPELSGGFNTWTEAYFFDRSETPKRVVNAANEPFENMPERDTGCMEFQWTKNYNSINVADLDALLHTVNSNTVTLESVAGSVTLGAGVGKINAISFSAQKEGVYEYWRVSYTIGARTDGWGHEVLNVGYTQLVSGVPQDIKDGAGLTTKSPWPLNVDGSAMTFLNDEPNTIGFKPYREVNWNL